MKEDFFISRDLELLEMSPTRRTKYAYADIEAFVTGLQLSRKMCISFPRLFSRPYLPPSINSIYQVFVSPATLCDFLFTKGNDEIKSFPCTKLVRRTLNVTRSEGF